MKKFSFYWLVFYFFSLSSSSVIFSTQAACDPFSGNDAGCGFSAPDKDPVNPMIIYFA